jgi:hypothetical protein
MGARVLIKGNWYKAMEMRIAATTRKLTAGATVSVQA